MISLPAPASTSCSQHQNSRTHSSDQAFRYVSSFQIPCQELLKQLSIISTSTPILSRRAYQSADSTLNSLRQVALSEILERNSIVLRTGNSFRDFVIALPSKTWGRRLPLLEKAISQLLTFFSSSILFQTVFTLSPTDLDICRRRDFQGGFLILCFESNSTRHCHSFFPARRIS